MPNIQPSSLQYSNKFGSDKVIQEEGALSTDLYGLSTITTVWKIVFGREDLIPEMFSRHPYYVYAALERRRIEHQGGFLIVTCDYAGVDGTSASVFELTVGVQDEPIVSHPKFVSSIGGKPSAPLNGAVFIGPDGAITTDDSVGQFAYFAVNSNFAGIESYLAADFMTWRERYCTNGYVIYSDIGFLSSPSGGPPVGATNWIKISTNLEQRGLSYVICNEWRAGGRRGWNPTIYSR